MAPGDFVRWMKQLIDLLDQVADAAPESSPVRASAVQAIKTLAEESSPTPASNPRSEQCGIAGARAALMWHCWG